MYKIVYEDIQKYCKENIKEFKEYFKLIYLDPPYNTKRKRGARKTYNDTNNNWSSSIKDIIKYCHYFLRNDGFLVVSINQMELFNLKNIIDECFGSKLFVGLFPVKIRHKDRQLMINATYHDVYEYLLIYRKEKSTRFICKDKAADLSKFVYEIQINDNNPIKKIISGKEVEIFNPNQYKIIKHDNNYGNNELLRRYIIAGKLKTANWSGEWYENNISDLGEDLLVKVYGLEQEGLGYRWFQTSNSKRKSGIYFQSLLNAGRPILPTNDLDFTDEVTNIYKEGGEGCDYKDSKKPEKLINYILDICTETGNSVLDMFGGSGTTLACCIKHGRNCTIVDNNLEAIQIIVNRLNNMKNGKDIDNKKYYFDYIIEGDVINDRNDV